MNIEVQGSVKQKWTCRLISGLKWKTLKHLENFASFRLPLLSAMLQPCNFAKGKGACMGVSRIFDIGCSYYSKVVCHQERCHSIATLEMRRGLEPKCFAQWFLGTPVSSTLACVARVSVWFRSKERQRNGIFGFGRSRNETRAEKWKRGRGRTEGKIFNL